MLSQSLHRAQPMRDHDDRLLAAEVVHRVHHRPLGQIVERGGRLVEHQHVRVVVERAGDADALALPAREPDAALAEQRLVALRQVAQDEVVQLGDRAPPARPPPCRSSFGRCRRRCWSRRIRPSGRSAGARSRPRAARSGPGRRSPRCRRRGARPAAGVSRPSSTSTAVVLPAPVPPTTPTVVAGRDGEVEAVSAPRSASG